MLREQFSAEWATIAVAGVVGAHLGAVSLEIFQASTVTVWALGMLYSLLFYPVLLGLGRTPICIGMEYEPAPQGYPRLSIIPPLLAGIIWAYTMLG